MTLYKPAFLLTPISCSGKPAANKAISTAPPKCNRRAILSAATLVALSPLSALAMDVLGVGDAIPAEQFETVKATVSGDTSFNDFVTKLEGGQVKKVWFFGIFNEYCCFEATDGKVLHIGEGYPRESPRTPESPLQVMAKVRNRYVLSSTG